jgi:hypothetical protein
MTTLYDEIQEKHQVILNDVQGKITQEHVGRVKVLIAEIIGAGEFIPNFRQREQLRSLLRYWTVWMFNQTGEYPPSQLKPFILSQSANGDRRRNMFIISVATFGLVLVIIAAILWLPDLSQFPISTTQTNTVMPPNSCVSNFWSSSIPIDARWQPQTDMSQGVLQVKRSVNQVSSVFVLELQVELNGEDENKSSGEVFIDLRNNPPLGMQAPLNLEDVPITVWVYVPTTAAGKPDAPNVMQVFAKSQFLNVNDNIFKSEYGSWVNLMNNTEKWLQLSLTPAKTAPPHGFMDEGFDPTKIVLVGIKIAAQEGEDVNYSGPIWISDACWKTP